jgi:hypothetical protein
MTMGFCRFGVDEEERDFWPCVLFLFLFFLGGGWVGVVELELDSVNLGFGGNFILLWFILIK